MPTVRIPFAYEYTGKEKSRRKPETVRVHTVGEFELPEMDEEAVVVARMPPPKRYASPETQEQAAVSELVWFDGSFWTQFVWNEGYVGDDVLAIAEEVEEERFHKHVRFGAAHYGEYGNSRVVHSEEEANFVRDVVSERAESESSIQRRVSDYAIKDGGLFRRTMEPLLVLDWSEPYRERRHDLPDTITPWARVIHRWWSDRDPAEPTSTFSDKSMESTSFGPRALAHTDMYRLDEVPRIADIVSDMTGNDIQSFVPPPVEVLRPDLLQFDRDAYKMTKGLGKLADTLKRIGSNVVAARALTRITEVLAHVGADPRNVYGKVEDVRDTADLVRPLVDRDSVGMREIDAVFESVAFQERYAESCDMDAISGVVSYRHVQAEVVYSVVPSAGAGVYLTDMMDRIAHAVGEVEGVVGILPSDRDDAILVRVSTLVDEEEVMLRVREAMERTVANRPLLSSGMFP